MNPGANAGVFKVESLGVTIPFNVFKFDQNSKLVLTDIDGTITESDTIGHVGYYVGFSAEHDDVVELFHNIGIYMHTIFFFFQILWNLEKALSNSPLFHFFNAQCRWLKYVINIVKIICLEEKSPPYTFS